MASELDEHSVAAFERPCRIPPERARAVDLVSLNIVSGVKAIEVWVIASDEEGEHTMRKLMCGGVTN